MKFVSIADMHLSGFGNDRIIENLPERLYEKKKVLYNIGEYCIKNRIENIIVAGDCLHNKSIIYTIAQNVLLEFFRDFSRIKFTVISGNHDLSGKSDNAVSALKAIEKENNVLHIGPGEQHQIENILFIPYSHTMVNQIKSNSSEYLVSHFGLNEGMLNSGISVVSEIGIKDLVGKYKKVILGHFHLPQEIIRPDIEVWYTGSITQSDWGEKGEEKRFLVVDTDKNTIQPILTEGYTKHFEFKLTNKNKLEVIQEATRLKAEGHEIKISRMEDVDIKDISSDFMIVDKVEKDITNRGINSSMTMTDKLNKFMEIKKISKKDEDKYRSVALDIISSC
jgi:DNA repair exonuclease SbcCD nuclease subunit